MTSGYGKAGLAALGLAVLAGCGESDMALTAADVARRGDKITFRETFTKQVRGGDHRATYALHCLDNSRILGGDARIVAVSGNVARARDYQLKASVETSGNRVFAAVSHPGAAFPSEASAPFVTVELTVTCDNPPFG